MNMFELVFLLMITKHECCCYWGNISTDLVCHLPVVSLVVCPALHHCLISTSTAWSARVCWAKRHSGNN